MLNLSCDFNDLVNIYAFTYFVSFTLIYFMCLLLIVNLLLQKLLIELELNYQSRDDGITIISEMFTYSFGDKKFGIRDPAETEYQCSY